MKNALKFLLCLWLCLLGTAGAWALPFSALYVFGDSLSDAGASKSSVLSLYNILGGQCDPFHSCPPYVGGHFSNGPTAAEYLAEAILPGGANATNFRSYAIGGATSGSTNFAATYAARAGLSKEQIYQLTLLPGMFQQVDGYLQKLEAQQRTADPEALYFVWGGANDFMTGGTAEVAATNIATYVGMLAAAGATHIMVPNLPELSGTPYARELGVFPIPGTMTFAQTFNRELAAQLDALERALATDIIEVDIYSLFNGLASDPARFGFSNAEDGYLGSKSLSTPDQYVFWDDMHPTTTAHALLGSAFAAALVPEPDTRALLALALLALPLASRKHARAQRQPG